MDVEGRPSWVEVSTFNLKSKPQSLAGDAHEDCVDEPGGDGHRLQGSKGHLAASHQEGGGSQAFGDRPEKSLEPRWVWMTIAGQAVDHKTARVAAGDEVENQRDEREDGEEGPEVAVAHHQVEPHLLGVPAREPCEASVGGGHPPPARFVQLLHLRLPSLVGGVLQALQEALRAGVASATSAQLVVLADKRGRSSHAEVDQPPHVQVVAAETSTGGFSLHPQTGAAKDDHPHEDVDHRGRHRPSDEFLHSATNGDLGNEHADKGTPGNPPAPVEDRPTVHPASRAIAARHPLRQVLSPISCSKAWSQLFKRVAVEAELENVLEVVAHGLHVEVEKEDGLVHEEDDQHEGKATAEAEFRDPPDPIFHP